MAIAILEGIGGREAPARNTGRFAVARLVACDARRSVCRRAPCRLGLDDASLATAGIDARGEEAFRHRAFFL